MHTAPGSAVTVALDRFVALYRQRFEHLEQPFDPEWRSPCELGEPYSGADGEQWIGWRPVQRSTERSVETDHFLGLEQALEIPIHPDIKAYYGRYWSAGLEATAPDGHVSLLLLWNAEDAQRLTENLIGHALAKRRARSGFTVFFACTEPDSDLFLSVDNDSGRIVLEVPGAKPKRVIAASLAEFLDSLTPSTPGLHPELG